MRKLALILAVTLLSASAHADFPTRPYGIRIQIDGNDLPTIYGGQPVVGINLVGFGTSGVSNGYLQLTAPSILSNSNVWTGTNTFQNYTFFNNYVGFSPTFTNIRNSSTYAINASTSFSGDASTGVNSAKVYSMSLSNTCDLEATGGTDNASCNGLLLNIYPNSQIANNENYLIEAKANNTDVFTIDQFGTVNTQGTTSAVGFRIAENSTGAYVFVGGEGVGQFSGQVQAASIKSPHVYPGNYQVIDLTSGSITVDLSLSNYYVIGLAGNGTIAVTHCDPGTYFTLSITQESGGSHTLAWPLATQWLNASYRGNGAGTAVTLSTTVGKRDLIYFVCDENSRPNEISENLGR